MNDFAENHNIAAENRAKTDRDDRDLVRRGGQSTMSCRLIRAARRALPMSARRSRWTATSYVFYPRTQGVPVNATANILNRPYSITADVEIPQGGAEGVLLSQGGNDGGYALYVQNGKLSHAYNYVGRNLYYVESTEAVPAGRHQLRFEFEVTGQTRHRSRQRRAGQGPALHRRQAGRTERHPADQSARHRIAQHHQSAARTRARR